jgi:antagonist of KipI
MTRAHLQVVTPGLLTTVQDAGRWGWQARGVPVGGPMDPTSYRVANALVGNRSIEAALEITLAGPELEFEDNRTVAVVGGEWNLTLNGRSVPMRTPIPCVPGDRLRIAERRRGARAYVAVGGGIDVPLVFGSRSTDSRAAIGGFEARALRAGDRVPLGKQVRESSSPKPAKETPDLFSGTVRVLRGPYGDWFHPGAWDVLCNQRFVVDVRSDRMGYRLQGPPLDRRRTDDMISSPTVAGAVQVTASGAAILLMADRQTIGGYPILAAVITADLGHLGQLAPGDALSFAECSPQEARAALLALERELMAMENG